jgi:N-acetyl-gamma-glutamyl-phosphate reductase
MIAGILGATGYAGVEIVRILLNHPKVDGLVLGSTSAVGERIEDIYPNLRGRISAALAPPEEVITASDAVFGALPSGAAEAYAKAAVERGVSYIDLSADFRFDDDEAAYQAWYGKGYAFPALHRDSVYGLPELNRQAIRASRRPVIIGNPGCYPTGATLGIVPALSLGLASPGCIIIDAASGVTGGGRAQPFHYPDCSDSLHPYKVGSHRHIPEISRNLFKVEGRRRPLIFTPHLAPMNRGILSTIYIPLVEKTGEQDLSSGPMPPSGELLEEASRLRELYADFYKGEPFVRVLPAGTAAATRNVRSSNYCDISVHLDQSGSTLIVASTIDNMVKGAAGQAVQNFNLVFGFEETMGLLAVPGGF